MGSGKKLLKDELNELLELQEEIYFIDSQFEEDSYFKDLFKNNENIVCIIVAEFMVNNENDIKKTHIHYDYNYWGSDKFHKILDKYNLMFEWQDSSIGIICMK